MSARAYYNEIDPYCCKVLAKQIKAGNLPEGDIDDRDIRDVPAVDVAGYAQIHLFAGIGGIPYGLRLAGMPDDFSIITGGFPCQDLSYAGKGAGLSGARSGLWREYARLIRGLRPRYALVENVPALLGRGIGTVLGDLAACGYDAEWDSLRASDIGAPHERLRVFLVAYPHSKRRPAHHVFAGATDQAATPESIERVSEWVSRGQLCIAPSGRVRLLPDAGPDGMGDGLPAWMERLRGLGNAVVPQVVAAVAAGILAHAGVAPVALRKAA